MLSLSDTGIGIYKEDLPHIFEPFYTTKEKGKGTGLGLAVVYGIVKQIGGLILADSEPGQGTTFKIYIPSVEEEAADLIEDERLPTDDFTGSETILVVEDDERLLALGRKILTQKGYRILGAKSGEEALEVYKAADTRIDLLLTDVVMPGMNGRELAEHMESLRPGLKVLYMSGYTDDTITRHGVLPEGIEFLEKPFTMEGLARKVRGVLDRKE